MTTQLRHGLSSGLIALVLTLVSLAAAPPRLSDASLAWSGPLLDHVQSGAGAESTLDRDLEPVIVRGVDIHEFLTMPVEQLLVYRFGQNGYERIPAQVDEVANDGTFVETEDGRLDVNDEVVFMARDAGDLAPEDRPITDDVPNVESWYEIQVSDPLSGQEAWAYIVFGDNLLPAAADDYVSFDVGQHKIHAAAYVLNLGAAFNGSDYLALDASGVDLLDRTKVRLLCGSPVLCPLNENQLPVVPDDLVRDGPVRVVLRNGKVMAYESMVTWAADYTVLSGWGIQFSTDFAPAAAGSMLFSGTAPWGVEVDGVNDAVPITPASAWWQLQTPFGSVIQVTDLAAIGEPEGMSYYYLDDSAHDAEDTGDRFHYGDVGVTAASPNTPRVTYAYNYYFLPYEAPVLGPTFEAYQAEPLAVRCTLRGKSLFPFHYYLPLVANEGVKPWPHDDFYTPPDLGEFSQDRLGEILRYEHIETLLPEQVAAIAGVPTSPYGAESYRVLYVSQEPPGTLTAVSGLLYVPTGPAPPGGFPVILHAHYLPDLADPCAPSRTPLIARSQFSWVASGYIVAATDFSGLGTPGLRPLLVGQAEAASMLDMGRAALRFYDPTEWPVFSIAANQILIEGHSLGGHAALFAHQLWPSYAPELNVLGTVVFSPVTELPRLAYEMAYPPSPQMAPMALAMYGYSQYYGAPEDPHAWMNDPYASEFPERAETRCVLSFIIWLGNEPDEVFNQNLLSAIRNDQFDTLSPWASYVDQNLAGNFQSSVPVLVLQGEADSLNPPDASEALTQRLCDAGTPTTLSRYPDATHFSIVRFGLREALDWMAARLAGEPVGEPCADGS
jgi:acetyl esterase/lipase